MQDPNDLVGENPESELSIVQSNQVNELFIVQAEPNDGITATEDAQNTPLQNEERSFIEQVDDAEQAPQEETIVEQWQQSSQNEDIVKDAAEEENPVSDENDIVLEAAAGKQPDENVEEVIDENQETGRYGEESDEKDVVLEAAAGEQPDENVEEVIEEKQETDRQDEENPASDEKDIVLEAAVEEPTDDNVEKVVDEEQETSRHDEENPTSDEKDIVLETAVEQPTDDNVEEKQEIIQQSTMTAAMTAVAQAIAGSRDTTTSTSLGIPTELVDIAYSHLVVQSTLSNELHKKNEDGDSDEEFVVESKHVEDKAEEKHKDVEEKAKDRKKANVVVDKKIAVVKTLGDDIVRRLEKKGAVKLAGHGFMTSVFTKGGISLEINKTIPPISGDELSSVLPKPKFNKTAILNAAPPPTWLKNRYGIHPKSSSQHNFHANSHPISLSTRPATQSLPIRPTSKHYKLIRELKHKREGEITELLLGYTAQTKSYLRKTSYPKMPRLNPFLPLTNTDHIMTCKTLALKPQSLIPSYNKRLPATHTFARLGKIGKGKEEGIKSYVDEKEMERGDIRARKGKKMAVTVVPVQRE